MSDKKSRQGETGVSRGQLGILEHTHNSYNCNYDPETEAAFASLKKHAQSLQHSLSEVLASLSTSVGNWCYTFDSRSKNLFVFVFFLHNDSRNWLILRRNSLVIVDDVKLVLMRMDKRVMISGTRLILMFLSGRKLRFF